MENKQRFAVLSIYASMQFILFFVVNFLHWDLKKMLKILVSNFSVN